MQRRRMARSCPKQPSVPVTPKSSSHQEHLSSLISSFLPQNSWIRTGGAGAGSGRLPLGERKVPLVSLVPAPISRHCCHSECPLSQICLDCVPLAVSLGASTLLVKLRMRPFQKQKVSTWSVCLLIPLHRMARAIDEKWNRVPESRALGLEGMN